MAKEKTVFVCRECGIDYPKAYGKCPSCGAWNSFVEQKIRKETSSSKTSHGYIDVEKRETPKLLKDIKLTKETRINTTSAELNRVLGGGLVLGSMVLVGGEPGIGKSTLALQIALNMANQKILYVSGEESANQLKIRSERIGEAKSECYILAENSLDEVFTQIKNVSPDVIIIDSIQTIFIEAIDSVAGSVSQIRECATTLLKFAKKTNTPVVVIGHITKEGSIAGPKLLEHIVDTVLQFEGDRNHIYRILRANKNRFGSTDELAIFEMRQNGLREVNNPSELLLSHHNQELSGIAIAAMLEGIRPFLIEVQALVSTAAYGIPQRSATGFDIRRLNMLLAVLEKRAGFKLAQKDVFLNIAGGLRVTDPAVDLAVVASVLSSNLDVAIAKLTALTGEVGLSGEIRPINRVENRIFEAEKLGFTKIVVPDFNFAQLTRKKFNIEIVPAKNLDVAFKEIFG